MFMHLNQTKLFFPVEFLRQGEGLQAICTFLVGLLLQLLCSGISHCATLEQESSCEAKTNYHTGEVMDSGHPWYLSL